MPGYGADERALFEDDATKLYEEVCQKGQIAASDYRIAEDGELRVAFDLLVEMGLLIFDSEQDGWAPEDPTSVQSRVVSPLSQEAAKLLSESSQWSSAFSNLAQSWRRAPQSSARGPFTYLRGGATINNVLDQLLAECEEELLTAQPEAGRDPRFLAKAALRDIELLERGATMRTLYQHSARRSSVTHKYVETAAHSGRSPWPRCNRPWTSRTNSSLSTASTPTGIVVVRPSRSRSSRQATSRRYAVTASSTWLHRPSLTPAPRTSRTR